MNSFQVNTSGMSVLSSPPDKGEAHRDGANQGRYLDPWWGLPVSHAQTQSRANTKKKHVAPVLQWSQPEMHRVGARGCTAVVACKDRSQQAQLWLHTVHT